MTIVQSAASMLTPTAPWTPRWWRTPRGTTSRDRTPNDSVDDTPARRAGRRTQQPARNAAVTATGRSSARNRSANSGRTTRPPASRLRTSCRHTEVDKARDEAAGINGPNPSEQSTGQRCRPPEEGTCKVVARPRFPGETSPEPVGEGGLEPPHPFEYWHLKPARLPFRHSPEWIGDKP